MQRTCSEKACIFSYLIVKIYLRQTSLYVCSERARVIRESQLETTGHQAEMVINNPVSVPGLIRDGVETGGNL